MTKSTSSLPDRYKIDVPVFGPQKSEIGSEQSERFVHVVVQYDKGGMNYFNYTTEPRGIYLSIYSLDKGERFERMNLFGDGVKFLVEASERLNRKRLAQLAVALTQGSTVTDLANAFLRDDKPVLRELVGQLPAAASSVKAPKPVALDRIGQLRQIVESGTMGKVEGQKVDTFSASAMVQIYDKLDEGNRAKYIALPWPQFTRMTWALVAQSQKGVA